MVIDSDKKLTQKEFANLANLSLQQVQKYVADGRLPKDLTISNVLPLVCSQLNLKKQTSQAKERRELALAEREELKLAKEKKELTLLFILTHNFKISRQ